MTTFDRQVVTECLSRLVTPGIKFTALADELGARKQDYAALRELMLDLVEEGAVQVLPGGAFALTPSGRKADPHGKPQPPPPVRPELPTRKRRSDPSPKPAKAAARKPALPWRPSKPAPDAVLALCAELGVPAARAAVIGDAPADLRMGRAAGAGLVIGVLTGVGDRATLEPLADAVLESVAALAPMSGAA